jgi:hypothetical protein
MCAAFNTKDPEGNWIIIVPISNLVLTKDIKREIQIDHVLFVDKKKFPYIRKRLRLMLHASEWNEFCKRIIDKSQSLAIIHRSGKPSEIRSDSISIIRDESLILASSQLGYTFRRDIGCVGICGEVSSKGNDCLFVNKKDRSFSSSGVITGGWRSLALDKEWNKWQKQFYFSRLLKIICKKIKVAEAWRECLKRAAVLVGKSLTTDDLPTAFLWNMIVLEMLLTKQGDKYVDALPERVEAFLDGLAIGQKENLKIKSERHTKYAVKLFMMEI